MEHLRDRFTYDHDEGCLRWQEYTEKNNISSMSRVKPGDVAGKIGLGEYKITRQGDSHSKSCGLRMIWQHVTGELTMCKIRTMNPRDTKFCIDNLYIVPSDQPRVHRDRAKNSTVVSYCFEHKQYTLVAVDHSYNKTVIGYYDNIDSALKALNEPEVSFL